MIRKISFDYDGGIRIETETHREIVRSGVVLLTKEQAALAVEYGWTLHDEGSFTTETEPHLYAVRR